MEETEKDGKPKRSSGKPAMIATVAVIIIVVAVMAVYLYGSAPVHRTDVSHADPVGDACDPDIDIVEYWSYKEGDDVVLALQVDGTIKDQGTGALGDTNSYRYDLMLVYDTGESDERAIVKCTYVNDDIVNRPLRFTVDGDTLRIYFPLSDIPEGGYMVGLEAFTSGPVNCTESTDLTENDRDGEVEKRWF